MNSVSLQEAKTQLDALCEAAIRGEPTVIRQDGGLVILAAYAPGKGEDSRAPGYFAECYDDPAEVDRENRCAHACD